MVACAVRLKYGGRTYEDNLIGWGEDEATGQMFIRVNRDLVKFFERDQYTLVDFQRRLSINSQLGRWLHDYYSTHAKPYTIKVKTIRDLCGSETIELFHFRAELRKSLDELIQVGLLTNWEISGNDLINIQKCPSASQGRHLIRKVVKATKSVFENRFYDTQVKGNSAR
jgi:hypothetical protein